MICINSITICPQNITITKGKWYYGAYAEICPTNATCKCLTWHSSNSNVASVNQNGYICGVSEGTAVIYAIAQDGSGAVGFCNVTVKAPVMVSSVIVTPSTKIANVGDVFGLSATVYPDNAQDKRIRWTSCNCNIADVDYLTGCVTAKSAGTTYICANAIDGSGVYGCCEVTVNEIIVEETVPGLKTIKQCRVRKEMSMEDSAILKDSNGANVKLNVGDTVPLLSTSTISTNGRVWYRILYDGMVMHVTADDNSFEAIAVHVPETPVGTSVTVNTGGGNLNVRCTPSTSYTELGKFSNGTNIVLTNATFQTDTNGVRWYAVYGQATNGTYMYGWCSGEYLGNYVEYGTLVDVNTLNVRSGAGTGYTSLGTISKGDTVEILEKNCATGSGYTWHKILYNGSVGYVVAGNNTPNFTFETRWVALLGESGGNENIDVSTLTPIVSNEYLTQRQMENNAMMVYDYLLKQGWSKNAICGAIANMQAESTLNPGLWEKGNTTNPGYGLVQWTPATKWTDYADSHGYNYSDLNRQLEYLIYSMQPGRGEWLVGGVTPTYQLYASEYISSTRSAYDLAIVFLLCYERPLDQSDSVKSYRGYLANNWLSFFNSLGW